MRNRIVASVMFLTGSLMVAAPVALRLGWALSAVGIVLGVALGVLAGVLWATAQPSTVVLDDRWKAET